jgi:hypothetical protein
MLEKKPLSFEAKAHRRRLLEGMARSVALKGYAATTISDIVREGLTMVLKKVSQRAPQPLESLAGKYQPLNCQDLKKHDQGWSDSIR